MRSAVLTEKVCTRFGNFYVHLDVMPDGKVVGLAFSTPHRLDDSAVGVLINALDTTLNSMIEEATKPD